MTSLNGPGQNTESLRVRRDGTSQQQRFFRPLDPLDPAYPRVDEHRVADRIVFARAYAAYLNYFTQNGIRSGDWQPFFASDISAQLAAVAIQDIDSYRQRTKEFSDFLKDDKNENEVQRLRDHLDYLFSCCGTVALRLDEIKNRLPRDFALNQTLENLIRSGLSEALERLIAYYKGGQTIAESKRPLNEVAVEKSAPVMILGAQAIKFSELFAAGLSDTWTNGLTPTQYFSGIQPIDSVYGDGASVFALVEHVVRHNLFTSIQDGFLRAYAYTVAEAKGALGETFAKWDRHEPHYALFLSFLHLLEEAREETNTLTGRHLDFYYHEILRLRQKGAEPSKVHLLIELAKNADSAFLRRGDLFKAGKDDLGRDVLFASDRDFVANQARVSALKTVYRHKASSGDPLYGDSGRFYASPIANSGDGMGAELTFPDKSWHPFFNTAYHGADLNNINMPEADIGFAISSNHFLLSGGKRTVEVTVSLKNSLVSDAFKIAADDLVCSLTVEQGWLEKPLERVVVQDKRLTLTLKLEGADPPIIPYLPKAHGYSLTANVPVLLVRLRHRADRAFIYSSLENAIVDRIDLKVAVEDLKSFVASNDFGSVDLSKPFQPFGASPVKNSAVVIGSREAFQKGLDSLSVELKWSDSPKPFSSSGQRQVNIEVDCLAGGEWVRCEEATVPVVPKSSVTKTAGEGEKRKNEEAAVKHEESHGIQEIEQKAGLGERTPLPGNAFIQIEPFPIGCLVDTLDFSPDEQVSAASRHGFIRLRLDNDFGQNDYQTSLLNFLTKATGSTNPGSPPVGPTASEISIGYQARTSVSLETGKLGSSRFMHIAPFGRAEQPASEAGRKVFLLPQFTFERESIVRRSEAEFYIGVTGLRPPQSLAMLFQVSDGTANPLTLKPEPHIHWSYLSGNEWVAFKTTEVEDGTAELLNSGIITFDVPREASSDNTLLTAGMYWIRAAVETNSDAVCRLRAVAAQGLRATFADRDNDPGLLDRVLPPGTVSKLLEPNPAIKQVAQPFETFGGRSGETQQAFYTRTSERLRHKDRGVTMWDYERLILEAFPQIYRVRCLNHTEYNPGEGKYRELAPGHVTIVAIPRLAQAHHDPLRPLASLGLLGAIEMFMSKRLSSFVTLHVRNPDFETVTVRCNVRFTAGSDETRCVKDMEQAITSVLSPWAFSDHRSLSFEGKVYKSALINFVEDLPYVDYVTDFRLLHTFADAVTGAPTRTEEDEVEASKLVSILVSDRTHNLTPIRST